MTTRNDERFSHESLGEFIQRQIKTLRSNHPSQLPPLLAPGCLLVPRGVHQHLWKKATRKKIHRREDGSYLMSARAGAFSQSLSAPHRKTDKAPAIVRSHRGLWDSTFVVHSSVISSLYHCLKETALSTILSYRNLLTGVSILPGPTVVQVPKKNTEAYINWLAC